MNPKPVREETPTSPEWLGHAWNRETIEWFNNLNEEEQYGVWDAFALIQHSAYFDGGVDLSVLPNEDFCVAALIGLTGSPDPDFDRQPEEAPFAPSTGGDLLLDALAYAVARDRSHSMVVTPGWLLGVRFSRERAQALLETYVKPATERSGSTVGLRDTFRYAILAHPDIPADLAAPHLEAMTSSAHANGDSYYFLAVWRRYLAFPRDSQHLADLADIAEDAILKDSRNNVDGNYFVTILRHLTTHADFPATWLERHNAMGYLDFPLLHPSDDPEVFERYIQAYPNVSSLKNPKSEFYKSKIPLEMSAPGSISDARALRLGTRAVNEQVSEIPIAELHPHTVGWYFESLRRTREALGVEDGTIPDEWIKELL